MASGYGIRGGQGRCFPHWQAFLSCYDTPTPSLSSNNHSKSLSSATCGTELSDYMECLHHNREGARIVQVQAEMRRRELKDGVEARSTAEMLSDVPRLRVQQ